MKRDNKNEALALVAAQPAQTSAFHLAPSFDCSIPARGRQLPGASNPFKGANPHAHASGPKKNTHTQWRHCYGATTTGSDRYSTLSLSLPLSCCRRQLKAEPGCEGVYRLLYFPYVPLSFARTCVPFSC